METENPTCPRCGQDNNVKNGFYTYSSKNSPDPEQKYLCKECDRQFLERSSSPFLQHRFSEEVIRKVLFLSMTAMSSRKVSDYMETFHVDFSHKTACEWARKFAEGFRRMAESLASQADFSRIWHVDEKWVKLHGSKDDYAYLLAVEDHRRNLLAVHLSESRDLDSVLTVLREAKEFSGVRPEIVVTDSWPAYDKAVKKLGGLRGARIKHLEAHFKGKLVLSDEGVKKLSNNLIERLFGTFQFRYRGFRGFKSLDSARDFLDGWWFYYNFLREHQTLGRTPIESELGWENLGELTRKFAS